MFTLLLAAAIGTGLAPAPCRQPQLAAAHGRVAMVFGCGASLFFAASPDQGRTFAPAVQVNDGPAMALGRHRGPRLAILRNALVISAIVGKERGTDLVTWRSTDQGRTWQRTAVVNDVPESAREGLHAMLADARGNLFAAWLDLRATGMRLYGARSTNGGVTWSKNVEIYASPAGTICQCCDPSLAFARDGRLWVMWRNVMDGSRDLWASSSRDGLHFDAARKLGDGTWKLNACPMDGGAIASVDGRIVSAWRREGDVYLVEEGRPEHKLGPGKDVAMVPTARGAYVAWSKGAGLEIQRPGASAPEPLAATGAFVNLAALADGTVLAAWETGTGIETKQLR